MQLFINCFFHSGVYKNSDFDSKDEFEVIDVDSQCYVQEHSDTSSVSAGDNDKCNCDKEGSDVESVTKDEDNDADFSSVQETEVPIDHDKSVDTEDASEVENGEESEEESVGDIDDGQYVDDPDKEEYGDIVETDPNPDFDVMLDLILHKKVTTAHVMSPSVKKTVYVLGKEDARKKLKKVIANRTKHGYDHTWVLCKETATYKKVVAKEGLAEGFNPDPSSAEESSNSESEVEEVPVKRKKGGKKKATAKKG